MRYANRADEANYEPNSLAGTPDEASAKQDGYVHYPAKIEGQKVRERSKTFGDHYSQAALFYNSLTLPEQEHIRQALQFERARVSNKKVQERMLARLAKIDDQLTGLVATCSGMTAPKGPAGRKVVKATGLSQEEGPHESIKSHKVAILVADGVTAADVTSMESSLKKAGATADLIAPHLGELRGASERLTADKTFATAASVMYDAVYVAEFEQGTKDLKDPQVKQWASATLPVLKEHLKIAQNLADDLGIGSKKTP